MPKQTFLHGAQCKRLLNLGALERACRSATLGVQADRCVALMMHKAGSEGGSRILQGGPLHFAGGRFAAETFGLSLQHITFTRDDIFVTARVLRENGLRPLEISTDYCDDLAARLGPDARSSRGWPWHDILYDRDAAGELFQLNTPSFGKDFSSRWRSGWADMRIRRGQSTAPHCRAEAGPGTDGHAEGPSSYASARRRVRGTGPILHLIIQV